MAKKRKSELVEEHGKTVYQSSKVVRSKHLKLKPGVEQLPSMEAVLSSEAIKPAGHWEEAEIPDTLDLADRAALGIHGIAGTTDPACYYQMWFETNWAVREPFMRHNAADGTCTPKYAESLPLLRTACGTEQAMDVEYRQMAHLLEGISEKDGLYYILWKPDRPWHTVYMPGAYEEKQEDYCQVGGCGRMMRAMMAWRERDGDIRWDGRLRDMARGLNAIAIHKDDYAYYPDGGHSIQLAYPKSGWLRTDEPQSDQESCEGSIMDSIGHPIYALSKWSRLGNDPAALETARRLANFVMKPKMWGGLAEEVGVNGAEQGHFHSHPHAHMVGLRALLEYGRVAEDARVLEFVRRSYEHLRTYMIPRIGWFPSNGIGDGGNLAEGCNLADLIALGIRLTDAGLGDYWEDVDSVVRNLLVEQQITDAEALRRVTRVSPSVPLSTRPGFETRCGTPDSILGIFASFSGPNSLPPTGVMGCCIANGTQAIYYAWEGALRCSGSTAQINLLINRVSNLVNVDSYLPFEGRVVIHNKKANRVAVRIASWIDRDKLQIHVAKQSRPSLFVGNYLLINDLKTGDSIELNFPVPESSATYTASHRVWRREGKYTYVFRGSTAVDVSPRPSDARHLPIYQRSHWRNQRCGMKKVRRFVPDRVLIEW